MSEIERHEDELRSIYARFMHLDRLLTDSAFDGPLHSTCSAMWLGIKALVEAWQQREAATECPNCRGTGFYGDRGSGLARNREWQPCECAIGQSLPVRLAVREIERLQARLDARPAAEGQTTGYRLQATGSGTRKAELGTPNVEGPAPNAESRADA